MHFLSKDGKDAYYEGTNGWKSCLFAAKVGIFAFIFNIARFFPISTLTCHVNNYIFRQGRGLNGKNESFNIQKSYHHCTYQLTVNIVTICFFRRALFCCTFRFG